MRKKPITHTLQMYMLVLIFKLVSQNFTCSVTEKSHGILEKLITLKNRDSDIQMALNSEALYLLVTSCLAINK